ncbi:MAG: ABC transporter ATP-binding protein [Candidatus Nanoarchaeia archaeon]|nr:ABC transporter ATP-binding protein [Candidatus Nanoarchaeia archaeon]
MTILQTKNLEASYGKLKVLNGIDIEVFQGDLIAIIGPNGSGKSTTLKTILGLLKSENGEIIFEEKKINKKNPYEIVKLGISYVPQGRMVFQNMTVEENLEIGGFILNDKKLLEERMKEIYSLFPTLHDKKYQKASFLSGGQQQMLSIARALILKPKILLLDEPSLGLAPNMMNEIFKIIKEINENGTTIILVEQNAQMALEIANKVCVLQAGKIVFKDIKEKINLEKLKKIYFE